MKVRFLELAQYELDDAFVWYEEHMQGLGRELLDEVDRSIRRIARWPLAGKEISPDVRRCLVKRFPYGIIYGIEEDTIVVVSFAHLHRKPFYWVERWEKIKKADDES
jgi:plasmid stabilization system protein ParE